jgi:hypothetical protein
MQRLLAHEEELLKHLARKQTNPYDQEPPPAPKPLEVILLDDYHHTFSSGERQRLLAMLTCGSTTDSRVLCRLSGRRSVELGFFVPKAFAGNDDLPRSLASRCIPILLQRKRPSDPVRRLTDGYAEFAAKPLTRWMDQWSEEAWNGMETEEYVDEALPSIPGLTPRQQDCAEPLLRLAALIGGDWPDRASIALSDLFHQVPAGDQLQLLADIRDVFALFDNPQYLQSKYLITVLATMENRPWAGWTTRQGKLLAQRLRRFKISSHTLRSDGSTPIFKGYRIRDFQDPWERYLPWIPPSVLRNIAQQTLQAQACDAGVPAAVTDVTGVTCA